ncbi:hypothetical protein DID88_007613 [Monilinia fructigena]|uniref:Geranylgeranyl transferase type II subunit beta n=1 Tax=Monilinia fructigena TaxID=38457 RepID=A0A395J2W9_9HELO|nr:hypothetical protein DID88_007613 [Monilinia fructigena]
MMFNNENASRLNVETHLIISQWAEATIKYETDYTPANVRALADHVHSNRDQAAPISSGSFHADGMIILPCSMKTLAAVNAGYCDDLISRAADVMLKERRRLVLAIRETPLSEIHLRNMLDVTRAGAIICPANASVLYKPDSIDDLVDQMIGRMLDLFDVDTVSTPAKIELEYWHTEHLRLNGLYWGLTALHLLGRPDALPRRETIDFVLNCQHESGGFGAAPGHDAHLLYTVSAVQILVMVDAVEDLEKNLDGKGKDFSWEIPCGSTK